MCVRNVVLAGTSFMMSFLPLQPPIIPPKFMGGQPHWVWQLRPIWLGRRGARPLGLLLFLVPEVFVGGRVGSHHRRGQPQLVDGQHRQRQPPQLQRQRQAETQQRPPLLQRLVVVPVVGLEVTATAARPHEAEAGRRGGHRRRRAVGRLDDQAASLVLHDGLGEGEVLVRRSRLRGEGEQRRLELEQRRRRRRIRLRIGVRFGVWLRFVLELGRR